jgi:hypothetical protein
MFALLSWAFLLFVLIDYFRLFSFSVLMFVVSVTSVQVIDGLATLYLTKYFSWAVNMRTLKAHQRKLQQSILIALIYISMPQQ